MPGDVRVERAGLNPAGLGSSIPSTSPSLLFFISNTVCALYPSLMYLWAKLISGRRWLKANGTAPEMNLISCLQSDVQKLSLGAEIYLSCLSQAEMGVSAEVCRGSANSQSLPLAKKFKKIKKKLLKCWNWRGSTPFLLLKRKGTLLFPGAACNFLKTAQ